MPNTIAPAPDDWFTSFVADEPEPDYIVEVCKAIVGETVDEIVVGLDLGETPETIASTVGVTLQVVELIAKIRSQWDDKRTWLPPPKQFSLGGRPTSPIAPEGCRSVPAHKCTEARWDDPPHWTTFDPCLICRARRRKENFG